MRMLPDTREGYQLFHQGTLAFARMEENGIRVDEAYLNQTIQETDAKISELERSLQADKVWSEWKKAYKDKANLGSLTQLGKILFSELGYKSKGKTRTGRARTDEEALLTVDLPFVKDYLRLGDLRKMRSTYLEGIRRELCDGFIHPSFNLAAGDDDKGGARSYRSSSSQPNLHNQPVRNPEIGETVRRCFIPREGNQFAEIDESAVEVRISYVYHKDPHMLEYLQDPTMDMHRDEAVEVYKLPGDLPKEWWKKKGPGGGHPCRYTAKNMFVFPQFYGSFYSQCAPHLWEAMDKFGMALPDGTSMREHLAKQGIKSPGRCDPGARPSPGTFEAHIKAVEDSFWGSKRFGVYADWKRRWYNLYLKRGWFPILTGFRVGAYCSRNQVINTPVQAVAFHCVLQGIIWLQQWLDDNRMGTRIVNSVHDSIWLDAVPGELDDVLYMAKRFLTTDLQKKWDWLTVPLSVEAEVGPVGASFYYKDRYDIS